MRIRSSVRWTTGIIGLGLLAPLSMASAQDVARDCSVPQEPNGLVRGDRVPAGCVLTSQEVTLPDYESATERYVTCHETLFHTPNAKRVVHENCVRLSDGRLVIPIAPFGTSRLGRGFQPIDRHFEPLLRPFGPLNRPFEPLDRNFEPLERPFGSAGSSQSAERRPNRSR